MLQLEELVAQQGSVSIAPVNWIGPQRDTLVLLFDDRVIGAIVVQKAAIADPLVLGGVLNPPQALRLLWPHLHGMLVGDGLDSFFFGVPKEGIIGWQSALEKEGYAERLGGEVTEFYRKRLTP